MTVEKYLNSLNDLSNVKNKNIFITGGNSGIGFELAKILASKKANLFLLCRNQEKANNAIVQIKEEYPDAKITFIKLDLADLSSIETTAKEIRKYDVDVFVNNAGVFRLPHSTTKDGLEVIMGTNFIGTLYLNDLLVNYFKTLTHEVKVVLESSVASLIWKFNFKDFFLEKNYKKLKIYGLSKLGINCAFYTYLEENENSNISYSLVHPGAAYTPLISKGYKNKAFHAVASAFMKIFFHSPRKASLSLLMGILERDKVSLYGPRGFMKLSGFPTTWKVKKPANCDEAITLARSLIKERTSAHE